MESSSIYGSQGSIYSLIDQYMKIESRPRDLLIVKKRDLNDRKSIFSELDSKLSELKTKLDYLLDPITDRFAAKLAISSNAERITAETQSGAVNGTHTVTVEQLARNDTRVSNQYTDTDSSFGAFTADETFTIEVAHPTDADPNNRVQISVNVTADKFTGNDKEVLQAIADAINQSMSQAVNDETIESDEVVHASLIHEETGKSRLILTSDQTGYTYRMDFGASTLLDFLNINANTQSAGTSGGYIHYVGTGNADSELNTRFVMDGLTLYRDSNIVDDAIDGVNFTFLDAFSQEETVTIETDEESVRADVNSFIEAYNNVISFLRENAQINPDTRERGELMNDYAYSSMIYQMRSLLSEEVTTTTSPDYNLLYDIGIEADQKGKLSITDSEKFSDALKANPDYVADIFTSDEGVAVKLRDYINDYIETGGIIDSSKRQIDSEVQNIQERIKYMNELLDKKEKQYFDEFTKLQETMYVLQNQQSFFNNFILSMSSTSYF